MIINAIQPEGFEDAYIPVLNPFEYGDIVRIMGDSRLAVVITGQEEWDSSLKSCIGRGIAMNYYSNSLTVEFLYPNGEFEHGHPNILALEKVERWDDEDEWNLVCSVSRLMKGRGSVAAVLDYYQANKFKKN